MSDWPRYVAFRLASGAIGLLPLSVAARAGDRAGRVVYQLDRPRREMARRHMHRVLGPEADVTKAAKGVFGAYGRYWSEVFWFRPRRKSELLQQTKVENIRTALDIHDRGEGMVLALPHMGNWELAGTEATRHGLEVIAVAESLGNQLIADWFVSLRAQFGIEVLLMGSKANLTRQLVEGLKRGAAVALVADRDLTGRGISVEFFGEKTTLPAGPAALALRAGVPLLPIGTYFRGATGHLIVVDDPIPVPQGVEADQVAEMTQALANRFESLIRRQPEDWHLVQPNWPSDK
ncbi:MAG: phosphatidylinositol mannoside acyltransferase [Acidimicrobiia bacterium]